ncbi:unnamed protein product [Rangifer tarandus platyrhynchus]|uniref:Uncharacterized protein n=2 Tax=Rangifer tarandus platyrhynchus TaxID=3082113 RepID=A0ABN8YW11_RANTA|nr:unnamed protein product [Rangifer tarandus platyrhynchus]CAI9693665.1 unnamed protein product [Rangifer tarandus platyrhynchus]
MVPGGDLLPGAQGGRFPFAAFPGGGEVLHFENSVCPRPESVPASEVPRAPPGASGGQSVGRLRPSSRTAAPRRGPGPRGGPSGLWRERAAFGCSLPPSRGRLLPPAGPAGSPAVPGGPDPSVLTAAPGGGRGLHTGGRVSIPVSVPGDPRTRGSSSAGLRRRAKVCAGQ